MAGSKLTGQYIAFSLSRQFAEAAEDVSYVDDSAATIYLKGVVTRDGNPEDVEREGDGVYEVEHAMVSVMSIVDPLYGGVLLDTAAKVQKFKGRNFSLAIIEGGAVVNGWIVRTVTGACGTWDLGLIRETRRETGATRRKAQ